jgi:hypothetical protein
MQSSHAVGIRYPAKGKHLVLGNCIKAVHFQMNKLHMRPNKNSHEKS